MSGLEKSTIMSWPCLSFILNTWQWGKMFRWHFARQWKCFFVSKSVKIYKREKRKRNPIVE